MSQFDARYHGSLAEYRGSLACGEPDPDNPGRYVLRLWTPRATLRNVRRESFETAPGVCVYPGATCNCGMEHSRWEG